MPFFVSEYSTRTGVSRHDHSVDDTFLFELLEPLAQHAIGNAGNAISQDCETAGLLQEHEDDGAVPAATDQLAGVMEPSAQFGALLATSFIG